MRVEGVLLVLAAVLALLWIVALQSPDEPELAPPTIDDDGNTPPEPSLDTGERPDLAPRPGAPPPTGAELLRRMQAEQERKRQLEEAQKVTVTGIVEDRRGLPVEGALVYQLGKSAPKGSDSLHGPSAITDRKGAFSIRARPLEGTWICARAPGLQNTFVDGAAIDPEGNLTIKMGDAFELRVLVIDTEGEPVTEEAVRVMPIANRGIPTAYPGPEAPEQERYDVTDEHGLITFWFDQDCPVVVVPALEGGVVTPKDRWLPSPQGTVEFVTSAGVTLSVKRVDTATGQEVYGPAWVTIRDDQGRQVDHLVRDEAEGGRLSMELPIPPGQYALELYEREREPAATAFTVTRPGEAIDVVIKTAPQAEAAMLVLSFPAPAVPVAREKLSQTQPLVFVRRADGGFDRLGWQRVELMKWQAPGGGGEVQLRPGEYDVVVLDRAEGACGTIDRVRLDPGETTKARVTLRGGTVVRLVDVLPDDLKPRSIRVHVEGLGWFTPVGSNGLFRGAPLRSEEAVLNALDRFGGKGVTLGPYPGRVTLHVTDWEGREHRIAGR